MVKRFLNSKKIVEAIEENYKLEKFLWSEEIERKTIFRDKEKVRRVRSPSTKKKINIVIMSRAFYIPPQTQNTAVGNSELVDILVATLLSLLDRRHRCTRRCCARLLQQGSNYVSWTEWLPVRWGVNNKLFLSINSRAIEAVDKAKKFGIVRGSYKASLPELIDTLMRRKLWDFCTKQKQNSV